MNDLHVVSERTSVILMNPDDDPVMLSLTKDQMSLLRWLEREEWLVADTVINTIPPAQII